MSAVKAEAEVLLRSLPADCTFEQIHDHLYALEKASQKPLVAREKKIPPSPLVIDDAEVLAGNWTWLSDENGKLSFEPR
jgi:hypothetical protein